MSIDDGRVSVCAPPDQVLRQIQHAFASQAELQRSTEILQNSIEDGKLDVAQVASVVASNQAALANIKSFLDACLNSFPSRMRPTAQSHVKAEKVFSTAELLEGILLYLSPRQLLDAIRVNHATLQIFEDSPKLHDMLQMRPHKDGFLGNTIASDFPGMEVELDSSRAARWGEPPRSAMPFNNVSVLVRFSRHANITIGSRCRSMLPVQLPIVSMRATVSCCRDLRRSAWSNPWGDGVFDNDAVRLSPVPSVYQASEGTDEGERDDEQNEDEGDGGERRDTKKYEDFLNGKVAETLQIYYGTGLTVGHISDAAKRIRQAHLYCPHAPFEEHASDGTVKPEIIFRAVLTLKKDDPYLEQKDKEEISGRLWLLKDEDKDGKIECNCSSILASC